MASGVPPPDLIVDPWSTTAQHTAIFSAEALLANVSLPEEYNTAFKCSRPVTGKISLNTLQKVISLTGLPTATIEKIVHMVVPPNQTLLSKNEFSLALALVAFAQKNMDLTFDNVLAHRADLPAPSLPNIEVLAISRDSNDDSVSATPYARPSSSLETDPWRHSLNKVSEPGTSRQQAAPSSISQIFNEANIPTGPTHTSSSPRLPDHSAKFPISEASPNISTCRREPFQWLLKMDTISLTISPDLGGTVFKHVNFAIHSQTHDVTVLRRYSDFCWLLEVLTKRYPFRLLPNLPPKRIGIDQSFMNRRRHGLLRFINFVGRHPVFREDPFVVAFLTEKNDIATYRRTHTTTLEEEFYDTPDTLDHIDGLPVIHDLDECLDKVRAKIPTSLEHYRGLCAFMERIALRQEASAADYAHFGVALKSLVGNEKECHVGDCRNCDQVMAGALNTSIHMQQAGRLMEEQARSTLENVVENLKRHRDLLVSMQELLERREKQLETANIEPLSKRIAVNEAKIAAIESAGRGGELAEKDIARFKAAIVSDQKEIEYHAQRRTYIQQCISTELSYFHKSRAFTSLMFQQFAEEQTQFTGKILKIWRSLTELTYEMPQDAEGFL